MALFLTSNVTALFSQNPPDHSQLPTLFPKSTLPFPSFTNHRPCGFRTLSSKPTRRTTVARTFPPDSEDTADSSSSSVPDEWGEKPSPVEPVANSDADPPLDEDEWGRDGGNGSPASVKDEGNEYDEEEIGQLKQCLVDSFYGTEYGLKASTEVRAEILELISQLEAKNPTPAPLEALDVLDGNWVLLSSPTADIEWDMLDKSKFFFLYAALFSSVSFALYPIVVLKTRLQVSCSSYSPSTTTATSASLLPSSFSSFYTAAAIFWHEGFSGFYRGFGTSLTGMILVRALYMGALEVTKSTVGTTTVRLGLLEPIATTIANGVVGLSAFVVPQVIWTPIDVISQRLMVQGASETTGIGMTKYSGGIDACKKILGRDGFRGLYRGFVVSTLTYAPSNAVWWASYSMSQRRI